MVATLKMLDFLLLCFLYNGAAGSADEQCKLSDLAVNQTVMVRYGGGGHTEYAVRVENRCLCSLRDVKLACQGFNSSVPIYPAGILRPDGDGLCTLKGGYSISHGPEYAINFYYGWRSQFSLAPMSSVIACS